MKSKHLLLTLLLALFVPWAVNAQETLTVYDGTNTNSNVPFYGLYADTQGAASECVIPSDQLADMAGGQITAMKFYISSPAAAAWTGTHQVYLGEVAETTLTGITGPSAFTVVKTASFDATGTELTIEFDEPYTYGGGNLLIGTYVSVAGNWKSAYFYGVNQTENTGRYRSSASGNGTAAMFLPKTTFTYTTAPVACAKPTGLNCTEVLARQATFTWTAEEGATYQYAIIENGEEAPADGDYINAGQTNTVTVTTGLNPETDYVFYLRRDCTATDEGYSTPATKSFSTPEACPAPVLATPTAPTAHGVTLSWTGNYESYTVMYREPEHTQGWSEPFNTSSLPTGWSRYGTLLTDDVLNGTTALTSVTGTWTNTSYGLGAYNWKINLWNTKNHWMVTPEKEVAAGYILSFDAAVTAYNSNNAPSASNAPDANSKFVVLISDNGMATWTVLQEWNGEALNAISNTGDHFTISLANYVGESVYVAFYAEQKSGPDCDLHIDNVAIGLNIPATEWAVAETNITGNTVTLDNAAIFASETTYEVKVVATCNNNEPAEEVESNVKSFTTDEACPAPTGLGHAEVYPYTAKLSWTENSGATEWVVAYKTANEEEFTEVTASTNPFVLGEDTPLEPNTVYTWKVRSDCELDNKWSVTDTFTTEDACPTPTLTVGETTLTTAEVSWMAPDFYEYNQYGADWTIIWHTTTVINPETGLPDPNLVDYYMYTPSDQDPNFTYNAETRVCTTLLGADIYMDPLEPNTTYYAAIMYNGAQWECEDNWSEEVTFTTASPCDVPTELTVSNLTQNTADVAWSGVSLTGYVVEYDAMPSVNDTIFGEDFESGEMPEGWTVVGDNQVAAKTWRVGTGDNSVNTGAHGGDYNALITHNNSGDVTYLITSAFDLSGQSNLGLVFSFINRKWSNDIDFFDVYYRAGEEGEWVALWNTTDAHATWTESGVISLPEGAMVSNCQFGFAMTDNWGYGVGLDDVEIVSLNVYPTVTVEVEEGTSVTLSELEAGTTYSVRVKSNCDEAEFCEAVSFTTLAEGNKVFAYEGDWNTSSNWIPAGAPSELDNVIIRANATITEGGEDIATANNITIESGSITIEDGGELQHNNADVNATVVKHINGYTGELDNYYLLATPIYNIVNQYPEAVQNMLANEYDLYKFDGWYGDTEYWRNYKESNFQLEPTTGYLYANSEDVDLTFTGIIRKSDEPVNVALVNEYDETLRPHGNWNLIGNPFVCSADLNYTDFYRINGTEIAPSDGIINPLEAVFVEYDAEIGDAIFTRVPLTGSIGGDPLGGADKSILNITLYNNSSNLDVARMRFGEGRGLTKFQLNPNHSKIYFPMSDADYAVVYSENVGEMPLNFKAENNGNYTLGFNTENVEFNYLHLIDNMTGANVDLLATPSYSFEAKSTDYASRFKIVFATGKTDDNFAYFSNGSFVISNEGNATLQVIDVTGRIISSETINGSVSINVDAAPGVYMLRLVNGDNVKVQKVVVK